MSYITKRGSDAMESAQEQNIDYSDILKPFTDGKSYNVRVPYTVDDDGETHIPFVEYNAHSVYKVFYTTPCTSASGEKDLYCQAADLLFEDMNKAKEAGNEDRAEEIKDQAVALAKKERYLVGFFDLETGEPIIIDLTKNQADTIIGEMTKRKKKLKSYPFTISKSGKGKNTKTSLDLIVDPDEELGNKEQKNLEATEGKKFDESLFEKVLKVQGEDEQIENLESFGFDVTRLGFESKKENEEENNSNGDTDEGNEDVPEGNTDGNDEDDGDLGF